MWRGLRDPSKCTRLLGELKNLVCRCCCSARNPLHLWVPTVVCWRAILTSSQHTAAVPAMGVSLLVGRSLDADVDVVFAGDGARLVVADVAVKSFKFRLVAVSIL